jgi:hypothetical protein
VKIRSELAKKLGIVLLGSLFAFASPLAQASDAGDVDKRSYRLGSIASWSEAIGAGIKDLALSSAAEPDEIDEILDDAKNIAAEYGVSVYRETDFLVTDLFPAEITNGKHVLLLYKDDTLDKYQALKRGKAALLESKEYSGLARENIARGFGRLLSYPESNIDERLAKSGKEIFATRPGRPALGGIWKAPTVSLDDPRWRIEDVACLNGCSLVSYNYLTDLLKDPKNDQRSVVELHADASELNKNHASLITTPHTMRKWANYDAANDAALDCKPDGDGLQHQITAPPPIEIEQRDDRVIIRYEYWNAVRTVFLDRSEFPSGTEQSRLGYSVGRYDGSTLIVETRNLVPSQISLAGGKFFLSGDARFFERYTPNEKGDRLDVEWSVVDPVNLREPYIGKVTLLDAPDWELDEFICEAITGEF